MQYIIIYLFCEVSNTKLPSNLSQGLLAAWVRASANNIWVAAICSTFKELASATTKLGQLPSAQQLGSWHMPLGCLTFSHPHQQKTAEVVFKSCTDPHAHWWLWDSAHSTSLINVSSWYACEKASISLHWLTSKHSLCISVLPE